MPGGEGRAYLRVGVVVGGVHIHPGHEAVREVRIRGVVPLHRGVGEVGHGWQRRVDGSRQVARVCVGGGDHAAGRVGLRSAVGRHHHLVGGRVRGVVEHGRRVGAFTVVVGAKDELVTVLHRRGELHLRHRLHHVVGLSGLLLLLLLLLLNLLLLLLLRSVLLSLARLGDLPSHLRCGRGDGRLLCLGVLGRAGAALEVFEATLELLAYRTATLATCGGG